MKAPALIFLVLAVSVLSINASKLRTHSHRGGPPGIDWKDYIDSSLRGTLYVDTALIIGLDGQLWASSGLSISPAEFQKILSQFKNLSDVYNSGVTVNGKKWNGVTAATDYIVGKDSSNNQIIIAKSNRALLIGTAFSFKAGMGQYIVKSQGEYLRARGY